MGELYKREYTEESIKEVIDAANENGFLVSMNHPWYSMGTLEFFGKLNGLFAMEIYNHIWFIGRWYSIKGMLYYDIELEATKAKHGEARKLISFFKYLKMMDTKNY